ncbi:EamA family transporter [Trebonia kvetii]|uniref:EamA family transporter n=1 Tax=Trebonia kvetii TaxID=2480626 RepID=A0A6P2C134_9ACTN|nr:EamA family transporter [Trebonia kvetii]TVZ04860.1 EamA family transporter [Trebonia kvetii]
MGVRATGVTGTRAGSAQTARAPVALPATLVLVGAVSVQSGAGLAARLFSELPPAAVTTLRLWAAALVMLLIAGRAAARAVAGLAARRAWADGVITLAFGLTLGFMNFAIYQAFARIPLGIAVTIEFLGPLSVTVAGTLTDARRASASRASAGGGAVSGARAMLLAGLGYATLAAAGVVLLAGGVGTTGLNWAGVAWAAAAGAAWAGYIVGSKAAGQRLPGASGLVIAMCVAAVAVTAPGLAAGGTAMFRPRFLAIGAGIGLLSSVVPYWLELETLRRIPARLFGVWMSVQPAVAALIGLAILGQRLSPAEWAGIACVVAASAGAAAAARPAAAANAAEPGAADLESAVHEPTRAG